MADNLVLIFQALELLDKIFRRRESDLVDVFADLISRHAETVVDHGQGAGSFVDADIDLIFIRQLQAFNQVDVLQLVNGVDCIGNQLSQEDILVAVQPFLDYRKNVFGMN